MNRLQHYRVEWGKTVTLKNCVDFSNWVWRDTRVKMNVHCHSNIAAMAVANVMLYRAGKLRN